MASGRTQSTLQKRTAGSAGESADPLGSFTPRDAADAETARPPAAAAARRAAAETGQQEQGGPAERPQAGYAAAEGSEEQAGGGERGADAADLEQEVDLAELGLDLGELPEICGEIWGAVFDIMATRRGPHWVLDEQEKARVGRASIRFLNAYIPMQRVAKAGPKLGMGLAVGLPVSKRLYVDAQIMKLAMQQQMQQAQAAAANQQWQDPAVPTPPAPGQPAAPYVAPDPSQYAVPRPPMPNGAAH